MTTCSSDCLLFELRKENETIALNHLRYTVLLNRHKRELLDQEFGYAYLHVTRKCTKEFFQDFSNRLQHLVKK